jgi:hypothetical protein
MDEKYNLLIEETRQSFFQLENLTTSIDNKAYGTIAFDTILLSIFAYAFTFYSSILLYIAPTILVISLILTLRSIWPQTRFGSENKETIKLFKTLEFKEIVRTLAANYTSYDIVLWKIYKNKVKYLYYGLKLTTVAIVVEGLIIAYFVLGPWNLAN